MLRWLREGVNCLSMQGQNHNSVTFCLRLTLRGTSIIACQHLALFYYSAIDGFKSQCKIYENHIKPIIH